MEPNELNQQLASIEVPLTGEAAEISSNLVRLDHKIKNVNNIAQDLISRSADMAYSQQFEALQDKVADYASQKNMLMSMMYDDERMNQFIPEKLKDMPANSYEVQYDYWRNILTFVYIAQEQEEDAKEAEAEEIPVNEQEEAVVQEEDAESKAE